MESPQYSGALALEIIRLENASDQHTFSHSRLDDSGIRALKSKVSSPLLASYENLERSLISNFAY
jgi:hypothetical protein